MVRWAFDTLGIEVTKDKRIIKKTYSALVKEYHPEEHPEEWSKIHKAYQAAMEYAGMSGGRPDRSFEPKENEGFAGHEEAAEQSTEDENSAEYEETVENEETAENEDFEDDEDFAEEVPAEEISADDDYNEMFQEAHKKWKEEKSEKALALARRLEELIQTPVIQAGKEWQHFFAAEFLPGAEPDELLMLLEAIAGNEISLPAADVIVKTMMTRKTFYQASMEFNKAALADDIISCIYKKIPGMEVPAAPKKKRKGIKGILKELLFGAAIGIVLLVLLALFLSGEGSIVSGVKETAVGQLNEKYGEGLYSEEDIEVEKVELYGSNAESLVSWKITEKGAHEAIAYVMGRKEDQEELLCFDQFQKTDIRQALEDEVNERTGRSEGKLYWNSEGGGAECIKDGYFHEKYEDDISEFLSLESKARETMTGTDYAELAASSGKNGKIDYYVPDKEVQTIKQRLEMGEGTEDKEFLAALGQCAADYEMQIRGIVLPGALFEEKMKQADWSEEGMTVSESMYTTWLDPSMPLAMMTGWYMCLPPDEQEYLKVENGMYSGTLSCMAEGIWGAESRVRTRKGMSEELNLPEMPEGIELPGMSSDKADLANCMKETETPDLLEIPKSRVQTAVSFCLAEGYELEDDYCLVIDKEAYGIPDSGYQVVLTRYDSVEEESRECRLASYGDPRGDVSMGDVLDGEGYLFVEYPETGAEEKAPVLTILY